MHEFEVLRACSVTIEMAISQIEACLDDFFDHPNWPLNPPFYGHLKIQLFDEFKMAISGMAEFPVSCTTN